MQKTKIGVSAILLIAFGYLTAVLPCVHADAGKGSQPPNPLSEDPLTSLRCNQFIFDASGSYDPDHENLSFFWDFGDGQTSSEAVTPHTYDKSGDYTVTLSITDNSGLECSNVITAQVVRANIPPTVVLTAPDKACVDQTITLDAAGSRDDNKNKLNYHWNFGDGTSAKGKEKAAKTYLQGGDYRVSLTVDDNSSAECSASTAEKIIHINAPPVAQAGDDTLMKCVSDDSDLVVAFDASHSMDINGDPLEYHWDFGDGSKGEGVKAAHHYADVGNYNVKLSVSDNSALECSSQSDFVTVKLDKAPKAEAGEDIFACPGEAIEFDGTKSYVPSKSGAVFNWFFGDGETAVGPKVTHSYAKAGKYQTNLSVESSNKMCAPSRDARVITINSSPSVNLGSTDAICLGDEIHFDASSASDPDGDELEYYWSMGDGTILRAGSKLTHQYTQGGTYRVTVIVDDGKKSACSTSTANALVKVNTPPVADAGANLACCVDKVTSFNASTSTDPDGDPLSCAWDFGDGSKAQGQIVDHVYTKSGSYSVSLTVDDGSNTACGKSAAGFTATVNSSPVPVINIR